MSSLTSRDDERPALSINERIVWISDQGPEYGNVRWLGRLQDLNNEWMAGVEFDNPVGSGTGLYRDRQLFETRLNHASLVPIIGLLKASDFHGPPKPKPKSAPMSLSLRDHSSSDQKHKDLMDSGYHSNHIEFNTHRDPPETKSHKFIDHTHENIRYHNIVKKHDEIRNDCPHNTSPLNYPRENIATNSHLVKKSDQNNRYQFDPSDDLSTSLRKINLDEAQCSVKIIDSLPPPSFVVEGGSKESNEALDQLLGKSKGIQGHNNSCYLDATLFSMFASTALFDSLLNRPSDSNDIPEYKEIQRILRDEIVRPLRTDKFVSADQVMIFRTMLERSSTVDGLTDQEKDPEEFLTLLLGQILKAEPYLKLSSGLESFFYQLIVDKDESMILPTVQDLCEQSFMNSTVRLREIPPCLLIQMPRFGRQYKMYPRIMPTQRLDITDILESAPRACGHRVKDCDNIARYECKSCYSESSGRHNARLSSITYCANCFQAKHFGKSHSTGIESHDKTKTILDKTPADAIARYSNKISSTKDKEIPRIYMDLFAVLCIETSHYVCFVKCGQDPDAPWCFFDSMADRRGEQNGYNIPEVLHFEEFPFWTSDKGTTYLLNNRDDKLLPEMAKRLVCDAYLCFYQYTGLRTHR